MTARLWHDFRYACRVLPKQPLFSLMSIGVLAIGISGATTVFSLFNGLSLRPYPVPQQERLVALDQTNPNASAPSCRDSPRP
jgi:hypothetical protein